MFSKLLFGISLTCSHPSCSLGSVFLLGHERRFILLAGLCMSVGCNPRSLKTFSNLLKQRVFPSLQSVIPYKKKFSVAPLWSLVWYLPLLVYFFPCVFNSISVSCVFADFMGETRMTVLLNQTLNLIHRASGKMITESMPGWMRKILQSSLH